MWQKTISKLALVAQMVIQVVPELHLKRTILLCDSWYTKQEVTAFVDQFEQLDMDCNIFSLNAMGLLGYFTIALKPLIARGEKL